MCSSILCLFLFGLEVDERVVFVCSIWREDVIGEDAALRSCWLLVRLFWHFGINLVRQVVVADLLDAVDVLLAGHRRLVVLVEVLGQARFGKDEARAQGGLVQGLIDRRHRLRLLRQVLCLNVLFLAVGHLARYAGA